MLADNSSDRVAVLYRNKACRWAEADFIYRVLEKQPLRNWKIRLQGFLPDEKCIIYMFFLKRLNFDCSLPLLVWGWISYLSP